MIQALRRLLASARGVGPDGWRAPPSAEAPARLSLSRAPPAVYAVGDVHGCLDKLLALETLIQRDAASIAGPKLIVMLGDVIDRGPASAQVLDHLIAAPPDGFHRVCLRGNHEDALLRFLDRPGVADGWIGIGRRQTLLSYGFDLERLEREAGMKRRTVLEAFREAFPENHRGFLQRMPVALSTESHFFAHAGARPGVALEAQKDEDLMWIRDGFLHHRGPPFGKVVVHGHTPEARPFVSRFRIGLDTGAFAGGPLTAARLRPGGDVGILSAP